MWRKRQQLPLRRRARQPAAWPRELLTTTLADCKPGPAPEPPHGFLPEPMLCKKQKNATGHRNKTEALQPLEVCCSPPNYLVANLSISFLNMRGTSDLCVDLHTFALSIRACPSNSSRHDKHDMTAEVFMPRL